MSMPENRRKRSLAPLEIAADHIGAAAQRQATVFDAKYLFYNKNH